MHTHCRTSLLCDVLTTYVYLVVCCLSMCSDEERMGASREGEYVQMDMRLIQVWRVLGFQLVVKSRTRAAVYEC